MSQHIGQPLNATRASRASPIDANGCIASSDTAQNSAPTPAMPRSKCSVTLLLAKNVAGVASLAGSGQDLFMFADASNVCRYPCWYAATSGLDVRSALLPVLRWRHPVLALEHMVEMRHVIKAGAIRHFRDSGFALRGQKLRGQCQPFAVQFRRE